MLVDVKRDRHFNCICSQKEFKKSLRESNLWKLWRIKKGFYHADLNAHLILEETIKEEQPIFGDYIICVLKLHSEPENWFNCYGVCDFPEQFMEYYEEMLEQDPRKLFVTFYKITKSRECKRGGWRWHKWGPYIGDKTPKHEYIVDEDDSIKAVYCYHVREAN